MYLNDWENLEQMIEGFWPECLCDEGPGDALDGVTILLASYHCESYEGEAFVLFEKGGTLFEVNASHCSCYGLEDQWKPEETNAEVLRYRMDNGKLGLKCWPEESIFADELRTVLDNLEGQS